MGTDSLQMMEKLEISADWNALIKSFFSDVFEGILDLKPLTYRSNHLRCSYDDNSSITINTGVHFGK